MKSIIQFTLYNEQCKSNIQRKVKAASSFEKLSMELVYLQRFSLNIRFKCTKFL